MAMIKRQEQKNYANIEGEKGTASGDVLGVAENKKSGQFKVCDSPVLSGTVPGGKVKIPSVFDKITTVFIKIPSVFVKIPSVFAIFISCIVEIIETIK